MKNKFLCGLRLSLVAIGICVCLVGCGDDKKDDSATATSSTTETVNEATDTSLDNAKEAYTLLANSSDTIEIIGAGISGAWGYAIENSSDFTGTYYGLASVCGLSSEEVTAAFDQYSNDLLGGMSYESGVLLHDFQTVISVLINYGYAPYLEQLDKDLASAKSLIKSVDQSESYYSDLVDYYTAVSNYLEFCKSPTGNYQSVGTTRNEYETTISTAKSKLSFYLE